MASRAAPEIVAELTEVIGEDAYAQLEARLGGSRVYIPRAPSEERSHDGGATAVPLTNLGSAVVFTGPAGETLRNREPGVLFRARCRVRNSGTFNVRLSQ